jgi:hypothetical protein
VEILASLGGSAPEKHNTFFTKVPYTYRSKLLPSSCPVWFIIVLHLR